MLIFKILSSKTIIYCVIYLYLFMEEEFKLFELNHSKCVEERATSLINYVYSIDNETLILNQRILTKHLLQFFTEVQMIQPPQDSILQKMATKLSNFILDRCNQIHPGVICSLRYLKKKFHFQYLNLKSKSSQIQPKKINVNITQNHHLLGTITQGKNNFEQQEINSIIKTFFHQKHQKNGSTYINCLGCIELFEEGRCLPSTGQPSISIQFQKQTQFNSESLKKLNFAEQLRKNLCSLLNMGGGYIFLHGSEGNQIKGLNFTEQQYNFISHALNLSLANIFPSTFYYNLQFKYVKSPNQLKHLIIIMVRPKNNQNIFSIIKRFKGGNKIAYPVYAKYNKIIGEIIKQQVYQLAIKIHKAEKEYEHSLKVPLGPCYGENCIPLKQFRQTLLNKFQIVDTEEQQPQFTFSNSTILIVSSSKYSPLIDVIRKKFCENKIHHKLVRPYIKYRADSLRQIWFLNHQQKFERINSEIMKIDGNNKKISLVIVTNFLQIKGEGYEVKFDQLDSVMLSKFKIKGIRETRAEDIDFSFNPKQFTFYSFSRLNLSVFAYIFLDAMSIRLEFVKENHFYSGHKKKTVK